ncbi:PAAR domain-containing protein [Rhodosalinus sp.]|uniref:PAAR domain-containing protein n=1 Tax=Rhodosalinus sp. TaxID=2047741 RepID=UPI00356A610D
MSFPQARMTDLHICPVTYGAPTPILPPCAVTVLVNKLPAARMTDLCPGVLPPAPHPITKGSSTVMIMKLPAARLGVDPCASGGVITLASFNVLTGG